MKKYKDFVEACEIPTSKAVYEHFYKIAEYDVESHTTENLEQFIHGIRFKTIRELLGFMTTFRKFAKFLHHIDLLEDLNNIDVKSMRSTLRDTKNRLYISKNEYDVFIEDIMSCEEYNELFYYVLIQSVYEGLAANDIESLVYLRASDINGNVVTLRNKDGYTWQLEISDKLALNLKELSTIRTWERKSRYGTVNHDVGYGIYPDSVFSVPSRGGADVHAALAMKLRTRFLKMVKEYLDFEMTPKRLAYSGILHRVCEQAAKEYNVDFLEILPKPEHSGFVTNLLNNEMARCGVQTHARTLRLVFIDNLKDFVES